MTIAPTQKEVEAGRIQALQSRDDEIDRLRSEFAASQSRAPGEGEWRKLVQEVCGQEDEYCGREGAERALMLFSRLAENGWFKRARAMLTASPAPSGDAHENLQLEILNGIRDALETRGYFHMANGRDIGRLLDHFDTSSGDGWREERERCAAYLERIGARYHSGRDLPAAIRALPPPPAHNAGEAAVAKGQ